ncbi:MAG: hypothetical protein AAF849_06435 [Bacteroidota bacterium]
MRKSADNIAKLRAKGVEVIYLCTNRGVRQKDWEKKVAELNLNAPHIYMNSSLSTEILSFFDLSAYPSHVLLDQNGKYIPDFHTRIATIDFEYLGRLLE